MILTTRPAMRRLTPPTGRKVKAINQVHKNGDSGGGGWNMMWDANYDWNGWLKPGVDLIKTLGGNTVKITGLSVNALTGGAAPLQNKLVDRLRLYLDYTASIGLDVYYQAQWNNSFGTVAQHVVAAVEQTKIITDYPHVIGYDLLNEPDAVASVSAANVGTYLASAVPQIKALTTIPLTVGLGTWAPAPTYSYLTTCLPYVDFWDFHCYTLTSGTPRPVASDLDTLFASTAWKPVLIGESGAPRNAYFAGWPFGPTAQFDQWTRLGNIASDSRILGIVGFSLSDYDAANFGVVPETLTGPRAEAAGPFALWPDVR